MLIGVSVNEPFLIRAEDLGDPGLHSFSTFLVYWGKGSKKGPRWKTGEVQSNLVGSLGRVIYKAKAQMLLPEKSPDQNNLLRFMTHHYSQQEKAPSIKPQPAPILHPGRRTQSKMRDTSPYSLHSHTYTHTHTGFSSQKINF